jgi:hypothetical protein
LTLIELEATESVALISCRNYLPEKSETIVNAFLDYLDRVIRQCRSCADSRETDFTRLRAMLQQTSQIAITTAGGLRSSQYFVEELALIDQPNSSAHRPYVQLDEEQKDRVFRGILRLPQKEAQGLARCVKILDAVIRHCDHSGGTIHSWIGGRTQPLKRLLSENNGHHPALRTFLLQRGTGGITFDFEQVLSDLVEIWSSAPGRQFDPQHTRSLLSRFFTSGDAIRSRGPNGDHIRNGSEVCGGRSHLINRRKLTGVAGTPSRQSRVFRAAPAAQRLTAVKSARDTIYPRLHHPRRLADSIKCRTRLHHDGN